MVYVSPIVAQFDNKFLDVDFGFESQTVGREMGSLPSDPDFMAGFVEYESAQKVYPRNEWPDLFEQIDSKDGWRTSYIVADHAHDQNGDVSCVYNMAAAIIETTWNVQFGMQNAIQLSPMSGYRWNGSPRSGSNIFGSAAWIEGTGLLPNRTQRNAELVAKGYFKHTHPHNGYHSSFMDSWKETAKSFRLDEWYRITTVEGWVSAYINGDVIGGGRDGHAIMQTQPVLDNGKLYSVYLNSWGSWGTALSVAGGEMLKSFGYDSESKIRSMINHGAYVGRTVRKPSWLPAAGV